MQFFENTPTHPLISYFYTVLLSMVIPSPKLTKYPIALIQIIFPAWFFLFSVIKSIMANSSLCRVCCGEVDLGLYSFLPSECLPLHYGLKEHNIFQAMHCSEQNMPFWARNYGTVVSRSLLLSIYNVVIRTAKNIVASSSTDPQARND